MKARCVDVWLDGWLQAHLDLSSVASASIVGPRVSIEYYYGTTESNEVTRSRKEGQREIVRKFEYSGV